MHTQTLSSIAVYPGTFDPITCGHTDIIERASRFFPKIIVAIAAGATKKPLFSLEERITLAEGVLVSLPNVVIMGFDNLLIDFVKAQGASLIIRGVRVISDFEYEMELANMNRKLNPEIETIFFTPAPQYTYLSSTRVKEIAAFKGAVTPFVHPLVAEALALKARVL